MTAGIGLVAMDIFQPIVDLVNEAIGTTLTELGTFWVNVPSEDVTKADGPVAWLQGELNYLVFAAATLSVIVAGIRMAISSRGEAARDILRSLLTLIVVMGVSLTFIGALVAIGDGFSKCLIASSITPNLGAKDPAEIGFSDLQAPTGWTCQLTDTSKKDFGATILAALGMTGPGGTVLGIIGIMFIGIWAIIASVVQIAMMIVRNGMLVVLVAVLPLAASATNTEVGRMWFKRCVSWLLAFVLYKPVAAIVYAVALRLMFESANDATGSENTQQFAVALKNGITAAVMMTLAIVALPALMKFLTPLVAATAGGAGMMAMTTAGQTGNELIASVHDETARDVGEPTGAVTTGGAPAGSGAGRRGRAGQRGQTGRRGRGGTPGTGGQGQGNRGVPSSSGQGATATATAAGVGSGGSGGSDGGGGDGGTGGGSGGGGSGGGGGGGAVVAGAAAGGAAGPGGSGGSSGSGGTGGTGPGDDGPDGSGNPWVDRNGPGDPDDPRDPRRRDDPSHPDHPDDPDNPSSPAYRRRPGRDSLDGAPPPPPPPGYAGPGGSDDLSSGHSYDGPGGASGGSASGSSDNGGGSGGSSGGIGDDTVDEGPSGSY